MTRVTNILLAIVFTICCTVKMNAQAAADSYFRYSNAVGLTFSSTTGSGLSILHRFGDSFSAKTVLYYYLSDNGSNKNSVANTAIELQYDVVRDMAFENGVRVYLNGSARYFDEQNSNQRVSEYNGSIVVDTVVARSNYLNCYNLGIGAELLISRRIALGLQIGYGFREERLYPEFGMQPEYPKREILATVGFDVAFRF